ncbi:MAG: hypothetical protein Ct9H300mP25_13760 [Acidobacteriota bacterium]|nr:MAG: hypothetical protein Ct9H300mP25_13760 [Acidobacteriota bacterium]
MFFNIKYKGSKCRQSCWESSAAFLGHCPFPAVSRPVLIPRVHSSGVAGVKFPDVVGMGLEGKEISLPTGLSGRRNLVAIAFEREHQPVVDTWIASVEPFLAQDPELRLYEVPTIYESSTLFRLWLNNGMRAGITDQVARRAQ